MDALISFGRYRGRSFDEFYEDKGYVDWFLSQPDMHKKYKELYECIIKKREEEGLPPEPLKSIKERPRCIRKGNQVIITGLNEEQIRELQEHVYSLGNSVE
mgnify:CR=1 FL=1|jgi:hypothetical protein